MVEVAVHDEYVILEWRGGSANRMAHVRWLGFDPRTGLPWLDSWEPRGNLTHDLRAGGLIRPKRPRDPGREGVGKRERGETGAKRVEMGVRRVSPRLVGLTAVSGI